MKQIVKILPGLIFLVLLNSTVLAQPGDQMTAAAVEVWADELFASAEQGKRYSGAVVSFVKNGEIVFAKGYGYADREAGTPVDAAATRFRIGSISKTFTATAIAQLIDQGRIGSLDDAANQYLKRLQLPSPGGKEITLKQLITHTAGFENRVFNIATDRVHDLPLSAEEVQRFAGEVVNEPGRYSSYNNFGTAVLGIVVEDITGETIADYFERHIFTPLGMDNSVLNMEPDPSPGLGVSYGFLPNGEPLAIPHRTVHPFYAPVGGVNATALDMARYMIAHLDAGSVSPQPLMSPAAFEMMQTRYAGNHELSSGFGMIFFVWDWNQQRLIVHGGDWPGTHSGMVLFPGLDAGIFFSLMADFPEVPILESIIGSERLTEIDGVQVDTPLSNAGVIVDFLERFIGPAAAPVQPGFKSGDLSEFAGNYVGQSAPHTTMGVMLNFANPFSTVRVDLAEAGGLLINGRGPYREIAPDVFWSDDVNTPLDGFFLDSPMYAFSRDEHGEVDYLSPQIGFDAWVKKAPLEVPSTYLAAWVILLLFLLSGLLCMFYPKVPANRYAKWLPVMIAVLMVSMPLVLLVGYAEGDGLVSHLFFGHAGRFIVFAALANLVVVLAVVCAWYAIRAWKDGYWKDRKLGWLLRIHYTLLSLAGLLLIPVFSYSNLLGF
jgi:CubicO group peptidase (beta-lactamase class C family)